MKIIFASSAGGHFTELRKLEETMAKVDSVIVTEKMSYTQKDDADYFLNYSNRKHLIRYFFLTIGNFFKIWKIVAKEKPDIIISTGAHTAFYFFLIGRLYRTKNVYIESYAKTNGKSLAYHLSKKLIDEVIVQHEEMLDEYEGAHYFGGVY